jgi:hypothetical protein
VLRAFGFIRLGWNAIRAFRRDRENSFTTTIYEMAPGPKKAIAADLGNLPRRPRRMSEEERHRDFKAACERLEKLRGEGVQNARIPGHCGHALAPELTLDHRVVEQRARRKARQHGLVLRRTR